MNDFLRLRYPMISADSHLSVYLTCSPPLLLTPLVRILFGRACEYQRSWRHSLVPPSLAGSEYGELSLNSLTRRSVDVFAGGGRAKSAPGDQTARCPRRSLPKGAYYSRQALHCGLPLLRPRCCDRALRLGESLIGRLILSGQTGTGQHV